MGYNPPAFREGRSFSEGPEHPAGPSPGKEERLIEALEIARKAAAILDSMKGTDPVLLDVSKKLGLTDYFLIVSAANRRLAQAMAREVEERLKAEGVPTPRLEGFDVGWWVLMDYGDLVIHIFREEARSYYDLDHLWADAPRVDLELPPRGEAV